MTATRGNERRAIPLMSLPIPTSSGPVDPALGQTAAAMRQTFHLAVERMNDPGRSPLRVLERMKGRVPACTGAGRCADRLVLPRVALLIVLLLLLRRFPLVFRGQVMPDRAAARRPQHAMMRHMAGDSADDGPLDAAFGQSRRRAGRRQGQSQGGR